jgi:hypothetical protein
MSGKEVKWTPQRRAAQAARMRALNADPGFAAKREAGLGKSAKHKAHLSRLLGSLWLDPAWRANTIAAVIRTAKRPDVKAKKSAASRRMQDRRRGASIPEGYDGLYRLLRRGKRLPAREALRLVRAQRAADLRQM